MKSYLRTFGCFIKITNIIFQKNFTRYLKKYNNLIALTFFPLTFKQFN